MKTGKYINLGDYKNIKIGYGSVDCVNLKSIYVNFNAWTMPNENDLKFDTVISSIRRNIKYFIKEYINQDYKENFIVDLDLRTKGIKTNKKSFMNLEITLYVNEHMDIKSKRIKNFIDFFTKTLIDKCLIENGIFNFYLIK